MTGFAAMGCNPQQKSDSLDDIGGARLGTLAYSPDGGMYMAIRAGAAITQYDLCQIEGNFDINRGLAADSVGSSYCVPQIALSDDDYGWGLVFGTGLVRGTAAVTAAAGNAAAISAAGLITDYAATNTVGGIRLPADAGTGARNIVCHLQFPVKVT